MKCLNLLGVRRCQWQRLLSISLCPHGLALFVPGGLLHPVPLWENRNCHLQISEYLLCARPGLLCWSLPVCFFITSLPFFCSALHVKTAEDFLGSLAAGFGLGSSNGSRGDGEPRLLLSVPFSLRCYLVLISSHQPLMGKFSAFPDSAQWLQSKEEVSLPLLPSMFPRRGPHYC